MNTTDANFKPTPGKWIVHGSNKHWSVSTVPKTENLGGIVKTFDRELISVLAECDSVEMQSNAALIVEAGTVYHETGKTPRRLAEENAALLSALEAAAERMEHVSQSVLIDKRHRGVSPATHVRHMAAHLEQHAKRARAAADKAKGGPTCAT